MTQENTPVRSKVALVTGGGSGLGAAISTHLAAHGYDIAIHYWSSQESARQVQQAVMAEGRKAALFQGDLTGERDILAMRDAFDAEFDRLDLLVNNAGVYHEKTFYDLTEAEWFADLNSTATAVYFTTRAFISLLRSTRGRVINIGDGSCDRPGARIMAPSYHVGKTGVWILTRSFAKHEAQYGVAVNMVSPGLLENSVGLGSPDVVPAGRFGNFKDMFSAIDFLAATDTPYITGSNLIVGGGWNL